MGQPRIKQRFNYRRGSGDDGYCRDCGNLRVQQKLFGKEFLNCCFIGVGTKKSYLVKHDFTCNLFWERDVKSFCGVPGVVFSKRTPGRRRQDK